MLSQIRPSLRSGRLAFSSSRQAVNTRPLVRAQAYVEASASYAVLQQGLAYAVVLGAEAAYTRSQVPEGTPGRPALLPVAGGVAATGLACGLVSLHNEQLYTPAFVIGLLGSLAMFLYHIKRVSETKQDDSDWPGPKAWPAVMALISFFALNVFIQGLRAEL